MMEQQLPEGWQMVRFGDIAKHISKRVEPSETYLEIYVGLEHLDPDSLKIKRHGVPCDVEGKKLLVKKGQIIFGKRRAYQRKVAVADWDCICSAHAMVLEANSDKVIPDFLAFFMQSDAFMERAIAISEGSLSPTIKWKTLSSQKFRFPPIEAQKKSVRLLKKVNECIDKYDLMAVSGAELCERFIENRIANSIGYQTNIGDLIASGDILEIQDGNHGNDHPKASEYVSGGIPFVMASDLSLGEVNLSSCKKLPRERVNKLRVGFSFPGDILLSHKGTVGLVAVTPDVDDYIMLTPQVTYYRVNKNGRISPRFLEVYFRSRIFQRILKSLSAQSTRAYIGITAQKKFPVPMLSIEQQVEIVDAWDTFRSNIAICNEAKAATIRLASGIINGV